MEIDQRFRELELGLVDASIVALAEELGVTRLATRDLRHFSAVRLQDGRAFELVVHPRRPRQGTASAVPEQQPTDGGFSR